jgi:hypothetical protein
MDYIVGIVADSLASVMNFVGYDYLPSRELMAADYTADA